MQEEEILGKAYDARLMRRMLHYLRPYAGWVALGILLSIAVSGMEAVRPYFTKIAVDQNIAQMTCGAFSGPRCCSSAFLWYAAFCNT